MPTFTRSAMNPNGSWQSDAQDQAEAFNANRGDNWLQWAQSRADRNQQNGWQRDVALAQIGLNRDQMNLGHEDRNAALQAENNRWDKQFGFMGTQEANLEKDRASNRDWINTQRGYAANDYADRQALKDQRTKFIGSLATGTGTEGMDPKAAAWLQHIAASGAPPDAIMSAYSQIGARPLETQMRREDQRTGAAEAAAADLESGRYTGERQKLQLQSQAARGGVKDTVVGRGQMVPAASVASQPEFGQAVESLREQLRRVPDTYKFGTEEGTAMGQILQQSIDAQAGELAKQFGTDPQQLARLMYQAVTVGNPGQQRGFLSGVGRALTAIPTLGEWNSQNEAAQALLKQRYGQ